MKTKEELTQKYDEFINKLNGGDLEIIGVTLWPHEMKQMLLCAPSKIQEAILEDALLGTIDIGSLTDDDLEGIGQSVLPHEMREMLLSAPLNLKMNSIDAHLEEQERINNLK